MKPILLGRALALLWVSAACADVLVQPDFEAKKVPEASMLGYGSAGGLSPCWEPQQWGNSDSFPHLLGLGPATPLHWLSLYPGNCPVCRGGGGGLWTRLLVPYRGSQW